MANYVGFSTIGANLPRTTNPPPGKNGGPPGGPIGNPIVSGKRYTLTDTQLVVRDLLNAFNIPQGQKPGQPSYGTKIWQFIFDQTTLDMQDALLEEVRRVCAQDPRIQLGYVKIFPEENGILIELQLAVTPFNEAQTLNVFFNTKTSSAGIA